MSESFETSMPVKRRELPHSIEAEEKFLSECFIDGTAVLAMGQKAQITHKTFFDTKHGMVYDTMLDLHARQLALDVFVVAEELKRKKQLEQVGGYPFLTQVSNVTSTTLEVQYVIDLLKRHERRRELIVRAGRLVEDCYEEKDDEIVSQSIDRLTASAEQRSESRSWLQAVNEAEEVTRDRMKPPESRDKTKSLELSWGIRDFDRCFQPIELGELVVIGGYTSSGKSSLLRQVIWSIVMAGHGAMIETIETLDREEAINLAAHIAGIRSRARLHELHDGDRASLLSAFDRMRVPHFMVSHQEHSLGAMFSRARAFKRTQRLRAVGTDYLQIMEDVSRMKTSSERAIGIAGVTGACKQFATKEELAVFLLSGFNREYIRGNREPMLSDLEGGSSIEKDASRVLLIHVPTEYVLDGQKMTQNLTANAFDVPRFYVKVIQAKGRDQGTATVGLMFHRETKTFHQITSDQESEDLV
jgi:replicative DNA helicase